MTKTPIELSGEFRTTIQSTQGQTAEAIFYVTTEKSQCILGCESSSLLGLIKLNINNITQYEDPVVAELLKKHEKLSKGTGNLKDVKVKLEIYDNVPPVARRQDESRTT